MYQLAFYIWHAISSFPLKLHVSEFLTQKDYLCRLLTKVTCDKTWYMNAIKSWLQRRDFNVRVLQHAILKSKVGNKLNDHARRSSSVVSVCHVQPLVVKTGSLRDTCLWWNINWLFSKFDPYHAAVLMDVCPSLRMELHRYLICLYWTTEMGVGRMCMCTQQR